MAGSLHRHELLRTEDTEDLQQPQRRQRSLAATLVCPEQLEQVDDVQCDAALKGSFMRLLRLEMNLSPVPQLVQLAELEGAGEESALPTQRVTLPLPDDARVLGFRYWEATDPATGFADLRDPEILLDVHGQLHLEPLSRRYLRSKSVEFPGRLQWMPPALGSLEKQGADVDISALPEVAGLRIIRGSVDHIVDCHYAQSWACTPTTVRSLTGQSAMFWVELFVLTLALFYLDIALDLKQLCLFWQTNLFGYFGLNLAGMALPPVFTALEALRFSARPSPEQDQLKKFLTPQMVVPVMLLSILTQTHMVLLVAASALSRRKHPLLLGAKHAEVAESAVSALVQTNFLVSALGGIAQIEALELSDGELSSMKLSVLVSCLSLGLGFASRDKADSAVLELTGKVEWGPTMGGLVLARSLEVFSRILAYNFLQASLRGFPLLRLAGLGAVALAFLAACVAFPDASWADAAAAVIAHPGQILEPRSLLKLRYSLLIHFALVAAAGGGQLLLRTSTAPPACKVLPDMLLIAWFVVSLVSWAALGLLSWLGGHYVDQPRFVALASGGDEPVIAYSSLLAAFPSSDGQVPKAVLAALQGNFAVDLTSDAAAHGLTQQGLERILASGADVLFHRHVLESLGFFSQEAVVDLLAASQPTTLHLLGFLKVPAASWERLGASLARHGERLRKANLLGCFFASGEGSRALLAGLARCRNVKELVMDNCNAVPAEAWAELRAAEWPELRKASFEWCFSSSLRSGEGSQDLLSALGRSKQLEDLNLQYCKEIPEAAWKLLDDGTWPRLRVAKGVPEEHRERLRGASLDIEAAGEAASSTELQEHGAKQVPMHPAFVTSVLMPNAALEVQQDGSLLPALAHCPGVEELILDCCEDIPAAVWEKLGGQGEAFPQLRKASFALCFSNRSEGAEGLLSALSRCQHLQELDMGWCREIPAAAWQRLVDGAKWPKLTKVNFEECFGSECKGIEAAAGLLAFLGRCPELKELGLSGCSEIRAAAWQQLEGAKWPKLTKVSFAWCFGSESKGIEAAAGLLAFLGRCPELKELDMRYCSEIPAVAWQRLEGAKWPKLTKVSFAGCFGSESKGIEAAAGLLAFLGCCPELKDLSMRACGEIPAAAWQRLVDDAKWPKLAKVNLNECFGSGSKGIEAAAGLLAFLGRCPELEELRMESCDQIPAAAWQQLETATWQKLTRVDFDGCFGEDSKGADGAAGLLTALARCPELKDGYITGL